MTKQYYYLVTVKGYDTFFRSRRELEDVLDFVKFKITQESCDYPIGYEFDNRNVLHLHTICTSKRLIKKEQYNLSYCSVNIKAFPDSDIFKIISYCLKEGLTPWGADTLNYISNGYYF